MYLLLIAVMFSAGGKMTIELEVATRSDCAAAFVETKQAVEAIGPIESMVGQCRAVT